MEYGTTPTSTEENNLQQKQSKGGVERDENNRTRN